MAPSDIMVAGIQRRTDSQLLIIHFSRLTTAEKESLQDQIQSHLRSIPTRLSPGCREKLNISEGFLYLLSDFKLPCIYFTGIRFCDIADRNAYELLAEVGKLIDYDTRSEIETIDTTTFSKRFRTPLKDLVNRCDSVQSLDKTSEVRQKVENAKGIMQENVKKILETHGNIDMLQSKTESLSVDAEAYSKSAGDLRRVFWLQKVKLTILLCLVIAAIIGYVIAAIVTRFASS